MARRREVVAELARLWREEGITLTELCRRAGVHRNRASKRLDRGYTLEQALAQVEVSPTRGTKTNPDGLHPDDRPCERCGKWVRAPQWRRAKGWARWCSPSCAAKSKGPLGPRKGAKTFDVFGIQLTRNQLAEISGRSRESIYYEFRRNRSVLEAIESRALRHRKARNPDQP